MRHRSVTIRRTVWLQDTNPEIIIIPLKWAQHEFKTTKKQLLLIGDLRIESSKMDMGLFWARGRRRIRFYNVAMLHTIYQQC